MNKPLLDFDHKVMNINKNYIFFFFIKKSAKCSWNLIHNCLELIEGEENENRRGKIGEQWPIEKKWNGSKYKVYP